MVEQAPLCGGHIVHIELNVAGGLCRDELRAGQTFWVRGRNEFFFFFNLTADGSDGCGMFV